MSEQLSDESIEHYQRTIDRVWCALGCFTYDDCKPHTIWEKVELLRKENEEAKHKLWLATEALGKMTCSCSDSGYPHAYCNADIAREALDDIKKHDINQTKAALLQHATA